MPFDVGHASESRQILGHMSQAAECYITDCSILTCLKVQMYNMVEELFCFFCNIFLRPENGPRGKLAVRWPAYYFKILINSVMLAKLSNSISISHLKESTGYKGGVSIS